MNVSRRNFLKVSGGTLLLGSVGINLDPVKAYAQTLRIKDAKESYTICPYCSVGCGITAYVKDGKSSIPKATLSIPSMKDTLSERGIALSDGEQSPESNKTSLPCCRRERVERGGMGLGP